MIEGINPVPPQQQGAVDPVARQKQEGELKKAAQEFEQVFMQQMFAEMRKSVAKTKLFGEGKDEEMFAEMLDQERAKQWSQSGGLGLAQLMFEQMRQQINPDQQGPTSPQADPSAPSNTPPPPAPSS